MRSSEDGIRSNAFWCFGNLNASGNEVRTMISRLDFWRVMMEGVVDSNFGVKREACYGLKTILFFADDATIKKLYMTCPEVKITIRASQTVKFIKNSLDLLQFTPVSSHPSFSCFFLHFCLDRRCLHEPLRIHPQHPEHRPGGDQ